MTGEGQTNARRCGLYSYVDRHELAWAAGFFDGEGWAAAEPRRGRRTRQPRAQINQSDNDGIPAVLLRFRNAVGAGRIGGPERKDGLRDRYWWVASSRDDVAVVAEAIWPWLGTIKRKQFAKALGCAEPAQQDSFAPRTEMLAWAGGLYDGEGCVSLWPHRTHKGHFAPEVAVTQSGKTCPEVLERFQDVVGRGRIYGPYEQEGAIQPVYRWKASARADIDTVLYILAPWITAAKRQQARRVMRVLVEQGRLPRGNPAWGSNKTHCVHGHEYATARIRPYKSRGKCIQRRENKQCLACVREQALARRLQKKRMASADD